MTLHIPDRSVVLMCYMAVALSSHNLSTLEFKMEIKMAIEMADLKQTLLNLSSSKIR